MLSDLGLWVCLGFAEPSGLAGGLGHGLGVALIAAGLFLVGAEFFRTGFRRSEAKRAPGARPGKQLQVIGALGEVRRAPDGRRLGLSPAAGRYLILRDDESGLQFVVETLHVTLIDQTEATGRSAERGAGDATFQSCLAAVAGRYSSMPRRWDRRG